MPTLSFKGKTAVESYHLVVPHHVLEFDSKLSLSEKPSLDDNLIIEGDNLLALKALLPTHAGKIKCVYIDPPYNTGNEGWIYNDNLTQPQFKEWIGKVVGKEGEDLTRHDKWCCMMYPRLSLLRQLLRDDGIVCISIDDNELDSLLSIGDEVFGRENRFGVVIVKNNPRGRRLGTELAVQHEYLVAYTREASKFKSGLIPLSEEQVAEYSDENSKGQRIRLLGLRKRGALARRVDRPNLHYPLFVNPEDRSVHLRPQKGFVEVIPRLSDGTDGVWRWGKKKVQDDNDLLTAREVRRRETGEREWDVFEEDPLPSGRLFPSIWQGPEFNNETGTDQLKELFGESPFPYPKPVDLIKHVVLLSGAKDDIILDSFAGSGTTAQAILELNHADGIARKFLLIQMPYETIEQREKGTNLCQEVTAQRAVKVVRLYNTPSEATDKFAYARLGDPLFDQFRSFAEGQEPGFLDLAKYVFYTETSSHFDEKQVNEKTGYIGRHGKKSFYLLYSPNGEADAAVTLDWLTETMMQDPGPKVVYAERIMVRTEELKAHNSEARQVPFNLK